MTMKAGTIAITGVGETPMVRASQQSLLEMTVDASMMAIADAGLKPQDIDGFVVNRNSHSADELGFALGIDKRPFSAITDTVGGTGPTGSALTLALLAIEAGLARHVLVPYGFQATRPGGPYGFHSREPLKADLEMPVGYFGQPSYFAAMANRYAHEYGLSEEELASVSITFRKWAELTPAAQKRDPMDLEGYRKSPMISTPFRVADCCLMTDAGAAYVVSRADEARDMAQPRVLVDGLGLGTTRWPHSMMFTQAPSIFDFPGRESAKPAFEMAGVTAADLDLAQIYDGFSISALVQAEQLGLCGEGEGGKFFHAGHAAPGGKMPVNTSGGHMSGGYLPGITLLIEGVRQLRHQRDAAQVPDATLCAVTGLGGNSHATTILRRG
ncbi:thiolase family protein [Sphingomonas crocodyli]|nr:thiolase family protein [Sphingomonas crocodyli]